VPLRIGLAVILGCAAIGSVLGVALPLHSLFPDTHVAEPPPELSLSSIRLVDEAPANPQKTQSIDMPVQPEKPAEAGAQQPAVALGTGSLDRPLLPGGVERTARTSSEEPEVSRPEAGERILNRNHRAAARSKKLRRVMARRVARPWKPQTSELEYFFGVPKK
jgi:hypothetical protein